VEVVADLERVTVTCGGQQVAAHPRCWAVHQTITDPAHAQAAAALRGSRLQSASAAAQTPTETEVEQRRLADYDALFGIDTIEHTIEGVA